MLGMRSFVSVVAAVPLLLASLGAAPQPDSFAQLDGHWRCTAPGARPAERAYFVLPVVRGRTAKREMFGRQDTTEADGTPSASFEHLLEDANGHVTVDALEGKGTSSDVAAPLHFAGRSFDGDTTMDLTYVVTGDTMRRTATRGQATVDDERCTREPEPPAAPRCERPNVPAAVLHAEEPETPMEAYLAKAKGTVYVRVVLDDRSRVIWTDVESSASPLLTDAAVQSARDSTYRTQVVNCRPIAAQYMFGVEFT
jgi:hypothetical protein